MRRVLADPVSCRKCLLTACGSDSSARTRRRGQQEPVIGSGIHGITSCHDRGMAMAADVAGIHDPG